MKQFHPFRLDTVNLCLWRGEQRVPLTPRAFDLLRYLVEHADRLVTQNEILDALWTGTYVNQEVIKKYILEIRKVLGDQAAQPAFIGTVPRRGYRFVAPVQDVHASQTSASSSRTARAIVGRASARARLESYLDRALTGSRQVIFITGEAGVGKTTLVDVFQQHAAARPKVRIARGQCVEGFGGKEAYYPALEAFGQMLRGREGPAVAQVLAERAPTWLAQFPSLVTPEQRETLQRDILGTTRERMVRELCEAVEALAGESPLVLLLEDLHWVDLASLDVVSALARRRGPAKLVVIATYRSADLGASSPLKGLKQDLLIHGLCEEIALERLEEADVGEFLAAELPGAALPAEFAGLIHRHSGGNPLFMVAIVQDMVKKAQLAPTPGGAWALAASLEDISLAVPDTLQAMLDVQFEQLSAAEQRILERASVVGERFSVWAITMASDSAPDAIENICEGLVERGQFLRSAGLLELMDQSVSAHYEFRHSLYRQAVYQRLSDVHRARLHRMVGERLSLSVPEHPELAGEVAGHLEEAREYGRAIEYLVQSADNAVRRFAYRESIETLTRALGLVPRIPLERRSGVEVQLHERIGDAHYWFGAMSASAQEYEAGAILAARAGLTSARVRALSGLMRPLGLIDPDRGIAAVEESERLSASLPDALQREHVRLLAAGSRLLYDTWRTDDWETCQLAREAILRLSGGAGLPAYHQVIYGHLQALQGNYAEALRSLDVGIPSLKEPASLMAYFFALSGRTLALLHSGELGDLLQIIQAGTAMAKRNGTDPWLFSFREAWLRTAVLDFDGARRLSDTLMGASADVPLGQPRTIARFATGCAELAHRRYDVARQQFEEILDPQITPKFFVHWYWRMNARLGLSNVWLAAGNLERAGEEANRFSQSASSTAEPNLLALASELQARVAMAARDWAGAAVHIQKGLTIVAALKVPMSAWRVHATSAELYRRLKDDEAAETHRKCAEAVIDSLANSFPADEPLRRSFLASPEIRRVLHEPVARSPGRTRSSHH